MYMSEKRAWVYDLLFVGVLLVAAYLRLSGVNWGEGYHQHPDENFLMGVLDNLRAHACDDPAIPIDSCPEEQRHWVGPLEYFDSKTSTLSPYNRGNSFFVYGNLPLTMVRYAMEFTGNDDIGRSKFFARQFSALADLFTIFILYLIVSNLYGRRVALFASAFSALAVMQIQQSHFFTTDLFKNLFMFLALLFVSAIPGAREPELNEQNPNDPWRLLRHPVILLSLGFGFALGMAMASKVDAGALAFALPAAFAVRYFMQKTGGAGQSVNDEFIKIAVIGFVVGGLATIISFRIFQPYAFDGIGLNPQWVANIKEQRGQATGEADLPWNLQWARRTHLYSFENLTLWGLGLPLGILAWAGFLWMGWRIFKGEWKHALLWGWTAFYFLWQSMQFNPTMRYQLPVYPLLCMMAAWFLFELPVFRRGGQTERPRLNFSGVLAAMLGAGVLTATAVWAFAFHTIYLRDEPRVAASRWIYQNVPGPVNINMQISGGETFNQPLPFPTDMFIQAGAPHMTHFTVMQDGRISGVTFGHAMDSAGLPAAVEVSLYNASAPEVELARASELVDYASSKDPRGPQVSFTFNTAVSAAEGESYILKIETFGRDLKLSAATVANETDYDYPLPFRLDGYDGFGPGMYRGDLVLQVYWDDNADKLARLTSMLNETDYILIPTNHQYAQITRLPERYPLTTLYYRELMGCPQEMDIIKCYHTAEVGDYEGRLGFELVAVFEDYPRLGPLVINDQFAEEAFTFYDHPKTMIFQKSENFDSAALYRTLSSVDLTKVVHLLPKDAANYKDLMLPPDRLEQQRAGGTWSELFDYDWLQNRYPIMAVLFWYAFIFLLGLAAYPIVRAALSGFGPYAYPLGRVVGLVLLAWLSWVGGSVGIPYTRVTIAAAFLVIVLISLGLWTMRRHQFRQEWNANRRFFVIVEIVFLVFFIIDLLIRLGNSDLWHPARGGERPMDFSYFNAVLKSSSFPPYDPWFAGGYINYYYYGFVLAGTPVKLLGIVPTIAYNLILPTWFALVAIGAFAVGFSVVENQRRSQDVEQEPAANVQPAFDIRLLGGLGASVMTILLGNLGTIQLIFQSLQKIAAPGGAIPADATFVQHWMWAIQGLTRMFQGATLPIGRGEWYWNPSRVIPYGPGNEITEFPLFTFLYSDLHAHMLVIPLTLFIIAWAVSFIKSHAQMRRSEWIAAFLIGALVIGALKPTNTWDLYAFFPFAALAVLYTINAHFEWRNRFNVPDWLGNALFSLVFVGGLYIVGSLMYSPFTQWYSQAYNKVAHWTSSHTPLSSYFTQWGLFLFIIGAWLLWEIREWMSVTPLSRLKELRPYAIWIEIALAAFVALLAFFAYEGVTISWVALPLAALAGILLLRPDMPAVKRAVLLMIGTGLALTLAVEVITLVGDLGRMNTIFKIYMQAWILFSVSAAAAFAWLLPSFPQWKSHWRAIYQVGLYTLLAGAFLFTLTATTDKISDRMTPSAPRTLDSITFMNYSQHWDGQNMELAEDYRAIRWLQDNVQGSPVIVEANCTEYRWCTRMTIYTGLPGVVGWNWHQRQQRALIPPNLITDRVAEIGVFYTTTDVELARAFLRKYDVRYIIVGQLERNVYPIVEGTPDGLAKFEQFEGIYWREVHRDTHTAIYEVIE
jgi:YYY domain-containing protein